MALATQCPHCGTTFRVAHDQLQLRAGLVRCGACKEIFNGIEQLLPAAAQEAPAPPAAIPPEATPPPDPPPAPLPGPAAGSGASTDGLSETCAAAATADAPAPSTWPTLPPAADTISYDPLQRMTLLDVAPGMENAGATAGQDADPAEAKALERAIDDLWRRPLRRSRDSDAENEEGEAGFTPVFAAAEAEAEAEEADEPDFLARARRQQRGGRVRRALLGAAVFVLLLGALAQGTYGLRHRIAAHFPQAKPTLSAACAWLGCRIELPREIDSVVIESSELQALAPERPVFALSVLLRNRGATVEAWPNLELTLNDAAEQPLVRRVFLPREYLPPTQPESAGFAANSEQALRLHFELAAPKAAGYRIYLFYS